MLCLVIGQFQSFSMPNILLWSKTIVAHQLASIILPYGAYLPPSSLGLFLLYVFLHGYTFFFNLKDTKWGLGEGATQTNLEKTEWILCLTHPIHVAVASFRYMFYWLGSWGGGRHSKQSKMGKQFTDHDWNIYSLGHYYSTARNHRRHSRGRIENGDWKGCIDSIFCWFMDGWRDNILS